MRRGWHPYGHGTIGYPADVQPGDDAPMEPWGCELVVLVGLQGSGRSTLVAARYSVSHRVVSKDHWPNARRREERQQRLIGELLGAGESVVVDNTNPSVEERAPLVALARVHTCRVVAVYVDTPSRRRPGATRSAKGRRASRTSGCTRRRSGSWFPPGQRGSTAWRS